MLYRRYFRLAWSRAATPCRLSAGLIASCFFSLAVAAAAATEPFSGAFKYAGVQERVCLLSLIDATFQPWDMLPLTFPRYGWFLRYRLIFAPHVDNILTRSIIHMAGRAALFVFARNTGRRRRFVPLPGFWLRGLRVHQYWSTPTTISISFVFASERPVAAFFASRHFIMRSKDASRILRWAWSRLFSSTRFFFHLSSRTHGSILPSSLSMLYSWFIHFMLVKSFTLHLRFLLCHAEENVVITCTRCRYRRG